MTQTPDGWRIADIEYPADKTSLVKLLSAKPRRATLTPLRRIHDMRGLRPRWQLRTIAGSVDDRRIPMAARAVERCRCTTQPLMMVPAFNGVSVNASP
jgi:hypothetical protein